MSSLTSLEVLRWTIAEPICGTSYTVQVLQLPRAVIESLLGVWVVLVLNLSFG